MRISIGIANDVLPEVVPGDVVTLRCVVSQVEVELLDTTTLDGKRQLLKGERSVSLVVEEASKEEK